MAERYKYVQLCHVEAAVGGKGSCALYWVAVVWCGRVSCVLMHATVVYYADCPAAML